MADIRRIGVFHYGKRDQSKQGHGNALSQLSVELEQCGDLSDSLLVLPEAFNIDGPYDSADGFEPAHDPTIRYRLSELSACFKVVLLSA